MQTQKSRAVNPANSQNLQRDYTTESGLNANFSVFRNSFDTDPAGETTEEVILWTQNLFQFRCHCQSFY